MKKFLMYVLIFSSQVLFSQYVLKNEMVLYSFNTQNGKKMVLVKDKGDEYIQYRFGTSKKIEMEFPAFRNKNSWKSFAYNYYVRGGGKENSGQEISNLLFTNNDYKYLIYKTYFAETEKYETGILITNKITNKTTRILGVYPFENFQGSLFYLDFDTPLKIEDIGLEF